MTNEERTDRLKQMLSDSDSMIGIEGEVLMSKRDLAALLETVASLDERVGSLTRWQEYANKRFAFLEDRAGVIG